ncbi:Inosine/uridine-preferring nucleoside hydrolase domain-containing protein [Aspergillus cavernicola]|uniref:Inosine/uridine-preferring nucleoside hydrolase domain-containing protein n=1 Tax=Aspergillus cavernicola TaxID=176166 RepID=A0ABR4IWH7_9EURO
MRDPHFDKLPFQVRATPKIIIENDWNTNAYITFLLAIDTGLDVLGLVGSTANSWSRQASLHALALLEIGNLSCIPVHKGADYPLLNSADLARTWETLHGQLPYQGVFKPFNATAEASGRDSSSGDPNRISRPAFLEGFPNSTLTGEHSAAWMVEQVRKHPGEVIVYSGGSLTNIALATRLDP